MPKVLINIPEPTLKKVDRKAKLNHITRTEAARLALAFWAEKGEDLIPPIERPGIKEIIARMDRFRAQNKSKIKMSAEAWLRKDRESH